jgi:tripartite-type tricarboxylate transporter receptor subunit TctC
MRRRSVVAWALIVVAVLATAAPAGADWKPTKPITIIVPWAAGGSTDQVTRVAAGELEAALGQKVVVVNQPGAAGSIGSKAALEAPKDGYTWTAGAAKDLGTYIVTGMLDTKIQDWHLYLTVANVEVFSVNPNTPYRDLPAFVAGLKEKPGQIAVGTAGVVSSGFAAIEALANATGTKYKHVTYDGGNPAVIATVAGEVQATAQLAVEQAEMIRAKRLRPLAVTSDQPLLLDGYGEIPPVTRFVPDYPVTANYFGIFVPKGVPKEVADTLNKVWAERIAKSEALKKYAAGKGAVFAPYAGDEAHKRVQPAIRQNAWQMWEGKKAKVSPDTVGIPKP